jgi:hypothetical protein
MRAVNPVNRNLPTRSNDTSKNVIALDAANLFPGIGATVAGINVATGSVNKEDTEMIGVELAGCCESCVVFGEVNNVVNTDLIQFDRTHGAPPLVKVVVVSGAPRGQILLEEATRLPITTLAAATIPATPACHNAILPRKKAALRRAGTERIANGWVKNLIVLVILLTKTPNLVGLFEAGD